MARKKHYFLRTSGISLVEIVVVVAIFSVLAVFTAPSLNTFLQRQKIHSVLRNISTLLLNARFAALKSNTCAVVEIFPDSCRAFLDNGSGSHRRDWVQQEEEKTLDQFFVDSCISLSNNCNQNTHPDKFRYTGLIRVSPCTITVSCDGEKRGKVVINSVGRTRIETFD